MDLEAKSYRVQAWSLVQACPIIFSSLVTRGAIIQKSDSISNSKLQTLLFHILLNRIFSQNFIPNFHWILQRNSQILHIDLDEYDFYFWNLFNINKLTCLKVLWHHNKKYTNLCIGNMKNSSGQNNKNMKTKT